MQPSFALLSQILPVLVRIVAAGVVLLIGRRLARASRAWSERAMTKAHLPPSMQALLSRILRLVILALTVLVALALLGVPVIVLLAGVAIIVIILGVALQQSLGDFAATVWFYSFRPFKAGDLIETQGILGTVQEIQLLSTVIVKPDNRVAILSNAEIRSGAIVNYSIKDLLRADVEFPISYADDLIRAKQILDAVVAEDARIYRDPAPQVVIQELSDNGIVLAVRPFVKLQDYWLVRADLVERAKLRFDAGGISLAIPRQEVHLFEHAARSFEGRPA
jgi:small conductance mechanosensitive channel